MEIDEKVCPLCGEKNNCQSSSEKCWCFNMEIPKGILDLVPEDKRNRACICSSCIEKYKKEGGQCL